jgi:hypothetical protein
MLTIRKPVFYATINGATAAAYETNTCIPIASG